MDFFWTIIGSVAATVISAFLLWFFREGLWNLIKKLKLMPEPKQKQEVTVQEKETNLIQEHLVNHERDLESAGNHAGATKLAEAQTALAEGDLSKADKLFAEIEESEELALFQFADISFARGYIAEVGGHWREAAQHYTRAAKIDPSFDTTMKAQSLALAVEDYDSALPLGKAAKKIAIAKYGKDSTQYANSLNDLGGAYQGKGLDTEAEVLYNEALIIQRKLFGEFYFASSSTLNNLAVIYRKQGNLIKAEQFFKQAIEIDEKSFGKEHHQTAADMNNLGKLYQEQKKYTEAETLYQKSLTIRKKTLGANHPDIADSLNNLALLYELQGKYEKVEEFYLQSINIFGITLGDEHPNTKGVKHNYEDFKIRLANAESAASQ